jgi:AcrR family transcriptional regulator
MHEADPAILDRSVGGGAIASRPRALPRALRGEYLGAMPSSNVDRGAGKPSFTQLKRGPRSIPAAEAAAHQRRRLQEAMVALVARNGFEATTINELVAMAGVSKATFYEHFADKEDCFGLAFDATIRRVSVQVIEAYCRPGDFRARLVAGYARIMEMVVAEPEAARFVVVESLTLGAAGIELRKQAAAEFESLIRRSFHYSPSRVEVPQVIQRGIVAGIRGVIYRQLRANESELLPGMVADLVDWTLSYQRRPSAAMGKAMRAAARPLPAPERPAAGGGRIPWEEPAASARSLAELTARQRIERAAAQVVAEDGYSALSIPAISAAAGISNTTFYSNFSSKREAFLSGVAELGTEALRVTGETFASESDRPEAVGRALRALLEFYAERELAARIAFVELPTAGPAALDKMDEVLDMFTAFLTPGSRLSGFRSSIPAHLVPAITAAAWAAIQLRVAEGRVASLAEIAPEVTRLVTGPMNQS